MPAMEHNDFFFFFFLFFLKYYNDFNTTAANLSDMTSAYGRWSQEK